MKSTSYFDCMYCKWRFRKFLWPSQNIRTCNSMNNLLSYFGLVDAKIRASDKDLPVHTCFSQSMLYVTKLPNHSSQDRPWTFAQLVNVQEKLGRDKFPLVQQTYFPGHQEMVSTLQSLTGKYRDLQGNPCNENRDPAMRTGVPCNEYRVFPVGIGLQRVPCKPYRVWVCSVHIQLPWCVYKCISWK